jgi:RNA polymerase sporulation-specific sigma factor
VYLDLTTPWLSFCFPGLLLLVGYITNQTFPHPLSEDQETSCLRRFRNGDEEARNLLIEHNLRLVAHILKNLMELAKIPMILFLLEPLD